MSARAWTIREVLEWTTQDFAARGLATPRLDAELVVAHALEIERIGLYLDLHRPLVDSERRRIRSLVARRRQREPVAYIVGHKDFYGRRFFVNSSVLIPRPDTETLVEQALLCLPAEGEQCVLDVGTGSGIVAITIALERPSASVTATDISEAALAVARANAQHHGAHDRIRFERVDLFAVETRYDLIVSNPPYVEQGVLAGLEPEVRDHEPTLALDGGPDGFRVLRGLLREGRRVTEPGSNLLVEVGLGQADAVVELGTGQAAWERVAVHADINGIDRVVQLRRV